MDKELVMLLVNEYTSIAVDLYNDLEDTVGEDNMRDALEDCMADRIHDSECNHPYKGAPQPEFRQAAKEIAIHFCGE